MLLVTLQYAIGYFARFAIEYNFYSTLGVCVASSHWIGFYLQAFVSFQVPTICLLLCCPCPLDSPPFLPRPWGCPFRTLQRTNTALSLSVTPGALLLQLRLWRYLLRVKHKLSNLLLIHMSCFAIFCSVCYLVEINIILSYLRNADDA
jgi:hypothetical protein